MAELALFNWSGGKDSALALYHTLRNSQFEVKHLLTSVNSETNRISMHGVRLSLLQKQAESIGIPLSLLSLPGEISMDEYDQLMADKMQGFLDAGISTSIFGDIFLEDLKQYREQKLAQVGLKGDFPLWQRNTKELVNEFISLGFKTIVVSVDGSKLDQSFVGRIIDESFLNDLPENVDPCGENGEFHSFVFEGPIFKKPIRFERGEVVGKEYKLSKETGETVTYWFQDLI
ncbi:Dph6-related ATP pyrophosphatase [Roseivirga spongicola]|uniref:ATP-binding protein n=1 Tax=Roseivirga spongicola TaxID=333140 RepID=A0A150XHW2_9BACT|nr:diphthine--ammonia ligase [Roseivirga spongicola]KYG78255.1 ATP-binding protein [Roseivirga spongicola]WPZ12002.1 diphthine--ammonia ligase [Roseivirga spongicola]